MPESEACRKREAWQSEDLRRGSGDFRFEDTLTLPELPPFDFLSANEDGRFHLEARPSTGEVENQFGLSPPATERYFFFDSFGVKEVQQREVASKQELDLLSARFPVGGSEKEDVSLFQSKGFRFLSTMESPVQTENRSSLEKSSFSRLHDQIDDFEEQTHSIPDASPFFSQEKDFFHSPSGRRPLARSSSLDGREEMEAFREHEIRSDSIFERSWTADLGLAPGVRAEVDWQDGDAVSSEIARVSFGITSKELVSFVHCPPIISKAGLRSRWQSRS